MSVKGPDRGTKRGANHRTGGSIHGAGGATHSADRGARSGHGADGGIRASVLVFAALGDATRLDLVARLCAGGPLSITRLTAGAAVTRQAITKHLNILAGAGLVRDIRVGRERLWEVEPRQLEQARHCLARISSQWDEALARLRIAVEGEEH
jgi:DNA-binding transcriptional ArsR family regulator